MDVDYEAENQAVKELQGKIAAESRVFMRQKLQAQLVELLNSSMRYREAFSLATTLNEDLKKANETNLIVGVQLEGCKAAYNLGDLLKARNFLTAARVSASITHVATKIQADIDMYSGILHTTDEGDFKISHSYFNEAFTGYDQIGDSSMAVRALKYILLCKVMLNEPEEVPKILTHKLPSKYSGSDLDAVTAIASASKKGSLADFNSAFEAYGAELHGDAVVKKHFDRLYHNLLKKNICQIIEPFTRVRIAFVVDRIGLDWKVVTKKLGEMISAGEIKGTLEQGAEQKDDVLIIYPKETTSQLYENALKVIEVLSRLVEKY